MHISCARLDNIWSFTKMQATSLIHFEANLLEILFFEHATLLNILVFNRRLISSHFFLYGLLHIRVDFVLFSVMGLYTVRFIRILIHPGRSCA